MAHLKFNKKLAIAAMAIIAIALVAYQLFILNPQQIKPTENGTEYHVHADFAVFIRGQKLNFSAKEFMHEELCGKPGEPEPMDLNTPEGRAEAMHLHDLNGNVLHVHNANATLPLFFQNMGFELTQDCIKTREAQYCNSQSETLKVYVNAGQIQDFLNYNPEDLDKILVTFGSESQGLINAQYESITSQACIYSEKCSPPSGFVLTAESCGS